MSIPAAATSAAGIRPMSLWSAMRGSRRKRFWKRCRPAQRRAAVPFRGDAQVPGELRHRPRLPAGQYRAHRRSALARRGAGEAAAAHRNIVYDAGNFLGIVPYLSVPGPGHFKLTSDFASIGLGFGTALGVAKARPDETTVLVIGDGGFLMTMGELETVVREDLPLVIVLMNDCAYGAELHFLKMRDLPVAKSVFPDVDYRADRRGVRFPGGDGPHARRSSEAGAAARQAGRAGVPRLQAERRRRRAVHERVPRVRDKAALIGTAGIRPRPRST